MTGYRPTDSATRLRWELRDSSSEIDAQPRQRDLFAPREFVEIKAFRGRVFSLACRWCKRRGYHLARCPRGADLRSFSELEVRYHYLLELAQRELANAGGRRMP